MYKKLWYGLGSALLSASVLAEPTANTQVVGLVQDADATVDAVAPIALGVAGLFLAISIGLRAWKRLSRG